MGPPASLKLVWFKWETKRCQPRVLLKEQVELLSLLGDIVLKDGQPQVHPLYFAEKRCRLLPMNMTLGFALLRDRRVPIRIKLIALGIGAAGVGAIELLQLPVEGVVAALLPFIGAAGDLTLDGAEAVVGPVLIATFLMPYLAPADLVRQIRAEAAGMARS
jgi:hypothetical protein